MGEDLGDALTRDRRWVAPQRLDLDLEARPCRGHDPIAACLEPLHPGIPAPRCQVQAVYEKDSVGLLVIIRSLLLMRIFYLGFFRWRRHLRYQPFPLPRDH